MPVRTKTQKLQIRMFKSDYQILKALADGEGLSMSAYLAKIIRQEAGKQGIPT